MRSIKYKQSHENLIMFIKLHSRKTPQTDEFNREVKKKITKDGNKIIIFDTSVDTFIVQRLKLNTELLAFLFFLEGCPKKLLLFLIICEVDDTTCLFSWNSQTIEMFKEFCKTLDTQSSYEQKVINKSLRTLVENNLIQNISRGRYMLNPLVYGGSNVSGRRELLSYYSRLLIDKNVDPMIKFYPPYK